MVRPVDTNSDKAAQPELNRLAGAAIVASRLLFGGAALTTVLGFFAAWSVLAEIFTHFRVVYALATFVALVLAVLTRRWLFTAATAVLLTWLLAGIVPWYIRPAPAEAAAPGVTLKVLTANVSVRNKHKERMLDLIAREKPDVVFVQELNRAWADTLANTYPYKVESERKDFFGLGLYSRFPIQNVEMEDPVGWDVPLMRADIVVEGRRVHLVNVHLSPPEGGSLTKIRLAQYPWLTGYVASVDGPMIVAGDFNCTMWSPLYTALVKSGKLVNAREGRGIMPSWMPLGGALFFLPLDHVLARGMDITGSRLTDRIGSDHCPIVAELRLPARQPAGG